MRLLPVLALLLLAGCVDVPTGAAPQAAIPQPVEPPFQGLDPGYKTEETAHFIVKSYGTSTAALYASLCEENYTRIMQDLGLYSFVPARPYNVVVYKDAAEFHRKTGQPEWSGGAAYANALLLFEGDNNAGIIAHEMTHLVFNEFMGLSQASQLRWLNEGVAVYEQTRADTAEAGVYAGRVASTVANNPIPFTQMVNLAPQKDTQVGVDRWYSQAWSVVSFLIRRGGSFNFSVFLSKLRDGADTDRALAETYAGIWSKFSDVETTWKLEVQR